MTNEEKEKLLLETISKHSKHLATVTNFTVHEWEMHMRVHCAFALLMGMDFDKLIKALETTTDKVYNRIMSERN